LSQKFPPKMINLSIFTELYLYSSGKQNVILSKMSKALNFTARLRKKEQNLKSKRILEQRLVFIENLLIYIGSSQATFIYI